MGVWDGLLLLVYMVGAGGIPTVVVAYLGRRKGVDQPKTENVEVASPWMVQNLLEIKMTVENVKGSVDAIVAAQTALAVQVNAVQAQLKRLSR